MHHLRIDFEFGVREDINRSDDIFIKYKFCLSSIYDQTKFKIVKKFVQEIFLKRNILPSHITFSFEVLINPK